MSIKYDISYNWLPKHKAFPYQHEAFLALKDLPYAAVFHEQGLGKTKIAIDLLLYWLSSRSIDSVIIVTKKILVNNWCEEFKEHTNLQTHIIGTNKGANFFIFNSPSRIIITNFETISNEKNRLKLFLKTRSVAIIMDESAKIKNPDSKLTKDFFELSPLFKIRLILTGTPVANRPYDIWSQIYFLDGGKHLGTDFKEFKKTCDLSNELFDNKLKRDIFEKEISSIFDKIKSFCIRETKQSGIISLPNKIYHELTIPFEPEQQKMYDTVREEMCILVHNGDTTILDESHESIKRLLRLLQIASNPKLIDDQYTETSCKEILLDKVISEIISRREAAIIWSIYTDNVEYFCKKYIKYNAVKITGKMNNEDRARSVHLFKSGEAQLLFATPQSAKEGLTLTIANNAIFYDRGFNLDDYLQAQDRIHRISQKNECHIYNLMVADSIDIWIDYLLKAKQEAASLTQGDISLALYKQKADYSFSQIVRKILKLDD